MVALIMVIVLACRLCDDSERTETAADDKQRVTGSADELLMTRPAVMAIVTTLQVERIGNVTKQRKQNE